MKTVRVGIIGLGTVGGGVAEILLRQRDSIRRKTDVDLALVKGADIRPEVFGDLGIPEALRSGEARDVLDSEDIEIVVELIGGIDTAKEIVEKALRSGKHVVTANKALLAEHGWELARIARESGVDLRFEASVAGGIPIIKVLREGLAANRIRSITGILNGTSNYILYQMTREGMGFEDALRDAQEKGFAEADPSLDVGGVDAAHKLAILASIGFSTKVSLERIWVEGIDGIRRQDIEYANELGYVVKPLAIARLINGAIEVRVHPTMVPRGDMLASVPREYNAVLVHGDVVGATLYFGKGAGRHPTASAIVADLIDVAKDIGTGSVGRMRPLVEVDGLDIQPIEETRTRYYLCLTTVDIPGVIGEVGTILGRNRISIASVIQKEADPEITGRGEPGEVVVPVVFMTHETTERSMRQALEEIDGLPFIRDRTNVIRIEWLGE